MKIRGLLYLLLTISLAFILTGCFKGEQTMDKMDPPPENAEPVNQKKGEDVEAEDKTDEESKASETVARQLYLVDVNGMVAPQTVELPNPESKAVAKQVLEYLVKGGPVTPILPNGFQAVLPEGTEIKEMNLKEDGTMVVDVSEEFKEYEAEDELKIVEAMTFTLTQFENVERIELRINGQAVDEMPVNGTPISNGYSRVNGINLTDTDAIDIMNSDVLTMYFPAEHNEQRYYVPITRHVEKTEDNVYELVVNSLLDGPGYNTNLIHVFNTDTMLVDEPTLEDGVLSLTFNENILKDPEQSMISDEVMETIVRSLTELQQVEAVNIQVENMDKLVNENGEAYEEPVSKKVFVPTDKL
ncbi:GerMN domain-containing protein [Virgibacillus soli]|uniref:GerMN domain-containing protein n=1 Tax=Paracerasibacillus soli TaxID=480284 RepID=A0ABU5CQH5_9BACI|nr:GerMN domain-containing protein [Virgibacillus soli]MDY0408601.1 GerMN domain-containing protein [Virgibacillus soli]